MGIIWIIFYIGKLTSPAFRHNDNKLTLTCRSRFQDFGGLWVAFLFHLFHIALLHLHLFVIIEHLLHSFLQLLTPIQRHLRETKREKNWEMRAQVKQGWQQTKQADKVKNFRESTQQKDIFISLMLMIAPKCKSPFPSGPDLEPRFALGALRWPGGTRLNQNKLLTGDGGDGLGGAADFSKWGAVIHGWLVYSGLAGDTRVKALPFPARSRSLSCVGRQTHCIRLHTRYFLAFSVNILGINPSYRTFVVMRELHDGGSLSRISQCCLMKDGLLHQGWCSTCSVVTVMCNAKTETHPSSRAREGLVWAKQLPGF